MKISFESVLPAGEIPVVIGVFFDKKLSTEAATLNDLAQGQLTRALQASAFKGNKEDVFCLPVPHALSYSHVIALGMGEERTALTPRMLEEMGGRLFQTLSRIDNSRACLHFSETLTPEQIARIAAGFSLRSWRFDKYKTKKNDAPKLKELVCVVKDTKSAESFWYQLNALNEGVFLTRHVVSEPPNVLYPESMAKIAQELTELGVTVEILGEAEMKKLGMGALLGVGQGSAFESQLIVLQWLNGPKDQAPLAIVGKGVTFDTGGISIKPSNNMEDMKYDMAGSGVVLGLMKALALRQAKVNVVGVMGMVENMPSGTAQRPADVVTSLSGQTIEIINTDAEGRLVLADALWYTQDRFKPTAMINLATLTGAISVALGHEYAGLFSNDETLCERLQAAGKEVGEKLWPFPMDEAYDKDIDSDIADVKNTGSGRGAGSITAAKFLERFVNKTPWAHLDIASMVWDKKGKPLSEKGATGYGVRLLNALIQQHYEK